jgi:nucleotide-binding universal stress UspA family protein
MAFKDLLAVIDDEPASQARLEVAARLATTFDAHLTGLYAIAPLYLPAFVEAELPEDIHRARLERDEELVGNARQRFEATMTRQGLEGRCEWRGVRGDPTEAAVRHGRYTDLVVVGQVPPHHDLDTRPAQPQTLVFECGTPLLVVPYAGTFPTLGHRILVGWNASRESARAVASAMPLLQRAHKVIVLTIDPRPGDPRPGDPRSGRAGPGDEPARDLARHLARHGCQVEAAQVATDAVDASDALLNMVTDESCDLLVLGAYGHSRLRELVLGGMTRTVLQHMTVPVLMSH